jgi:hypothetical protein
VGFSASARIDEGWLLFDACPSSEGSVPGSGVAAQVGGPAPAVTDAWKLLALNATLPGRVKFVAPGGGQTVRVRAELPLDGDTHVCERVRETCGGLAVAMRRLQAGELGTDEILPGPPLSKAANLGELCEAARWPFIERPDGRLVVDLGVPSTFQQASVEQRATGEVHVWADLAAGDPIPAPMCQQALGILLLRASAAIRMARAAAELSPGARGVRFEVAFASEPSAAELAHTLSALSVACRLYAREAAFLQRDETVAGAYLGLVDRRLGSSLGTRDLAPLSPPPARGDSGGAA